MGDRTQGERVMELEAAVRELFERVVVLERRVAEIPVRHAPFTIKRGSK